MTITFTEQSLKSIPIFEKVTHARVKDCFDDTIGTLVFIVEHQEIGKALGRGGANIAKLKGMFKRNIRIIEFNPDVIGFIKNVARPIQLKAVEVEADIYTMIAPDLQSRGYLIGRNASVLRNNEHIVKRYFPVKEIKVKLNN